jgi:DNA-binding response OmpR family regulator
VEDEPLVREILQEDLADAGLYVMEAATAEDALQVAEGCCPPPPVLVTDVNLGPGMDGVALAQEMQRRWPQVGLVVMTGDERNVERLPEPLRQGCLVKPFSPSRLVAAVTVLLRRPDRGIGALPSGASTSAIKSSGSMGG